MVAWREELARREVAAVEQVEALRGQLKAAEELLSRLVVTREMMNAILTEDGAGDSVEVPGDDDEAGDGTETAPPQQVSVSGGVQRGLVLVPPRTPGIDAAVVLPDDYCDILAVLTEAGGGLRAGQVAAELGISTTDRSKVESLRSKMKRLVARGWVDQAPSGVFTIIE